MNEIELDPEDWFFDFPKTYLWRSPLYEKGQKGGNVGALTNKKRKRAQLAMDESCGRTQSIRAHRPARQMLSVDLDEESEGPGACETPQGNDHLQNENNSCYTKEPQITSPVASPGPPKLDTGKICDELQQGLETGNLKTIQRACAQASSANSLDAFLMEDLCGLTAEALAQLMFAKKWPASIDAFKLVRRWCDANQQDGHSHANDVRTLLSYIRTAKIPNSGLRMCMGEYEGGFIDHILHERLSAREGGWGRNCTFTCTARWCRETEMCCPRGVCVLQDGSFLIADWGNRRAVVYSASGVFERLVGNREDEPRLFCPWGVCSTPSANTRSASYVDEEERGKGELVFVSDMFAHRVLVYRRDGRFVREIGGKGNSEGKMKTPLGVAVNYAEELYVCDSRNRRVQVFGREGEFLRAITSEEFVSLRGITINHRHGSIAITDQGNATRKPCIHVLNSKEEHVSVFGVDVVALPEGISTSAGGDIVVADKQNKMVYIFSSDGHLLQRIGGQEARKDWPCGVAVRNDGGILVSCVDSCCVHMLTPHLE